MLRDTGSLRSVKQNMIAMVTARVIASEYAVTPEARLPLMLVTIFEPSRNTPSTRPTEEIPRDSFSVKVPEPLVFPIRSELLFQPNIMAPMRPARPEEVQA